MFDSQKCQLLFVLCVQAATVMRQRFSWWRETVQEAVLSRHGTGSHRWVSVSITA